MTSQPPPIPARYDAPPPPAPTAYSYPPDPPQPTGKPMTPYEKKANLWRYTLVGGAVIVSLLIGIAIGAAGKSSGKVKEVAAPAVTVSGPTATVTTTPTQVVSTAPGTITTVTYTPTPKSTIGDGTYAVGSDIMPGIYKTTGPSVLTGSDSCYWARLRDLSGGDTSIIANNNYDGPTTLQILATDKAVEFNGGCTWVKQ